MFYGALTVKAISTSYAIKYFARTVCHTKQEQ